MQPNDIENRYRQLVERASDIIYETDANGFFTYANPVASEVVGRPLSELVGLRFTQLIRKDVRRAADMFYFEQARKRTLTTYYEFPLITADGREVWIGQNVQLLMNGQEIVGFQAVARDVTAQHENERFKDELLAVVSHELRTPLTAIRGALGLIKSGKLPKEKSDEMVAMALANAERMTRMLQDFLDLERIRVGHVQPSFRDVDIPHLLSEAVTSVQPIAEESGIEIRVRPVEGHVRVDHDLMLQALGNLLTNAIKFSNGSTTIELCAEKDADETRLMVVDQGRGIPADKLTAIWEPFRQVDQSDAREKGGLGLGLAITHSIIRLHSGRIDVKSEVGQGTTFTIHLPHTTSGGPATSNP